MKVQISKTNSPVWRDITVKSKLPNDLSCLEEVSKNLWWVWNSEATELFNDIDPVLWKKSGGNPVQLLETISYERLEAVTKNIDLMVRVKVVCEKFNKYISEAPDAERASIAYFSMEYGLANCLKIYSGGLGVLAGDYLKEASDSNVRMTAVGFLYRYGYFTQSLSIDGKQEANYEAQVFNHLPIDQVMDENGHPIVLEVPFHDRIVYSNVWRVNVGRIQLYLMDTDVDMNSEYDRSITFQLYGGDWENRMKQEYMLGIGGILLLDKLGIKKDIYHCNEGHAALINAQRLSNYINNDGLTFDQALEIVRSTSLYTVHTPVPAGHDSFDEGLFGKYMGQYAKKLGITWQDLMNLGRENPNTQEKFSMSVFACNTCQEVNGVSWLHGKVSQAMFQPIWKGYAAEELHVSYVTNGVHLPTWAASEWKDEYEKIFGENYIKNQVSEDMWSAIYDVPDEEIWNIRLTLKNKLVNYIRSEIKDKMSQKQENPAKILQTLDKVNPNALLVGFARRFATYKRAHLLFTDLERLAKIVNNPSQPVQFIFAGKAHPADGGGQDLIRRIVEVSRRPEFLGKIIFIENYDMQVAKRLISGVDIWMNTPTRPLEASGTSGEKAQMNGTLNFSVLDGWWYEGYVEGAGWALTDKRTYQDQGHQDQLDAETIYSIFENEIIPLYFAKNSKGYSPEWVQYIKNSLVKIAPRFTMKRMLNDYYDRFYTKESVRAAKLEKNDFQEAKEIAAWKELVASKWDDIEILSVDIPEGLQINPIVDEVYKIRVEIDRKDLPDCLGIEMVITNQQDGHSDLYKVVDLKNVKSEGSKTFYETDYVLKNAGMFKYSFRMYPKNSELPHRQDFAYVRCF